ncbi:MAG: FAD-binding and (Fe-S)-binding domain-containing protein [Burkholderiaceae bacterium]|nr:FAD-binding and (Fe-S)-binding domain-containing protein [Burkholderiaceae bacterium]
MLAPAPSYDALRHDLARVLPAARIVTEPLRRLAYGTDASFYRLVPQIVVTVESEDELRAVLAACRAHHAPLTFRAAGTSLSGQAISDSVLVLLGDAWRGVRVSDDASTVRLQPAVIGAAANRALAPFGRKIGPDPASIDAAMIGGIAANNASGMCCGTRQNSYHTLAGIRVMLADGSVLDTEDAASAAAFKQSHAELLLGLAQLAQRVQRDAVLAERIRHKYRMKNTTGYGLNALVDFADPLEILAHLMIGSEGTLGFISAITYRTVPEHAHKAAALLLFDSLRTACTAVTALATQPVEAVELMDRAALASVEHKPGMPTALRALGADGAALLVETRAADAAVLQSQTAAIVASLAGIATATPIDFSTDAEVIAKYWKVRKGTFPSVGAMRATGSTVIIEDVAFPVARLAEATLDLQALLHAHGYREAIIFGHALEGNLHFVFTQDFGTEAEVERYARFMDDVAQLVVGKYDGALKAEHGTGRNMAPFVELEWGRDGLLLMQEIKRLFDPENLLNPGVILTDDERAHLRHLKPLPPADPLVDKCIECGFCEPKCPSARLTFTPRQRIVGFREIARVESAGGDASAARAEYGWLGVDTCAACGLCATACPVEIETGKLIKAIRGEAAGPLARRIGAAVADHYGATTAAVRVGLASADLLHAAIGTRAMSALTGTARRLSGGAIPRWTPQMPRAAWFTPPASTPGDALVYFPSCAARSMGAARGDEAEALPTVTDRLLRRAGYAPVYPPRMTELCCGQPFESKGLMEAADHKSAELVAALLATSDGGRLPVVFDTSPCAYRIKRFLAEQHQTLCVLDITEALHDLVLPRLQLTASDTPVAVHPVCSVRKMGLENTLLAVARACSTRAVMPAEIGCCGWAGDKGFTTPELNAHALRDLKAALPAGCTHGVSTSRTCEIGLSDHAGVPYRSIVDLVDHAASRVSASSPKDR